MGSASLRVGASDTKGCYIKARMASCSATLNAASVTCRLRRKPPTLPAPARPPKLDKAQNEHKGCWAQFLDIFRLFVVVLLLMEVTLHACVMVFLCLAVAVCISFCRLRQPQLVWCHAAVVFLFFLECLLCLCRWLTSGDVPICWSALNRFTDMSVL